jgi:hypothetical protein
VFSSPGRIPTAWLRLRPAWNLAVSAIGKRKIHLWRVAVESGLPTQDAAPEPDLAAIIAAALPMLGIAPAATVTISAVDLAFRFCVGQGLISKLLAAGELREIGRHSPINETPRISYASAAAFLERRVL